MVATFTEYMGLVLSYVTELFSIELFTWERLPGEVHSFRVGGVVLFGIIVPVMYKILFPSPS